MYANHAWVHEETRKGCCSSMSWSCMGCEAQDVDVGNQMRGGIHPQDL